MEASLALRRHFCSRSTQLIAPLARYLNTLIPSPTEVQRARMFTGGPPASAPAQSSFPPPSQRSGFTPPSPSPLAFSSEATSSVFPSPKQPRASLALLSPSIGTVPLSAPASGRTPTQYQVKHQNHHSTSWPSTPNPALRLKPFNNANFFASLKANGSTLPFKSTSKRTEFYERCVRI